MQKTQLSSFQEDEPRVDAQGFLLNCNNSQSDLNSSKERKKEGEEEADNDDERNNTHPAEQVVGYDLSPFVPSDDDMKYFFEHAAKEECCVKLDTNASWRGEEKNQEESLLQRGGTKEQLARIEMYNTCEVDSDSDDDDDDDDDDDGEEEVGVEGEQDEIAKEKGGEEEEKPIEEYYTGYTGLQEEEEEEVEEEDGCLNNEQDGSGCLDENDVSRSKPPLNQLNVMETPHVDPSNVEFDVKASSGENINSQPQSELGATGTGMEGRGSNKPAFAATVPLLKPPPKEKMEAYLKSKGWDKM